MRHPTAGHAPASPPVRDRRGIRMRAAAVLAAVAAANDTAPTP